jgi:MoaA/NifB/PqqE/SkfB family radical SAM enzyme
MSRFGSLLKLCRYGFVSQRSTSPLMVVFNVTTRCDMKCRHCGDDVWGDPANDLPLAEIERFSQSLGRSHDLALGGGEPFLRNDLPEICELFVRNGGVRNIGIPTNGYATDRICDAVEKILAKCPETRVILMPSLDGFQATHDNIRTPGSFDRVMETGRRLSSLKEKNQHLDFYFNATINHINWRELPSLASYVRENFRTHLDFNILTGTPRDAVLQVPSLEDIAQTIDGIYTARGSSPLMDCWLQVYRDILLRTNAESRQIIPCRAGSLIAMVDANGDVRACSLHPALGNLREQSFSEIWHGTAAREQHKSIAQGDCACNNDCFLPCSLNHFWKLPFLMLRERMKW